MSHAGRAEASKHAGGAGARDWAGGGQSLDARASRSGERERVGQAEVLRHA